MRSYTKYYPEMGKAIGDTARDKIVKSYTKYYLEIGLLDYSLSVSMCDI